MPEFPDCETAPVDLLAFRPGLRDFLRVLEDHFDALASVLIDTAAMMPGSASYIPGPSENGSKSLFGIRMKRSAKQSSSGTGSHSF